MATVTPVAAPTSAGTAVTLVAASAGGDTIATSGFSRVRFIVRNASGSSVTVTFAGSAACDQGTVHTYPVVCGTGVDTEIVVPGKAIPTNGNVAVTYSAVTSVTVAAVGS